MAKFKLFWVITVLIILLCSCSKPQKTTPTLPPAEHFDQMTQILWDQSTLQMDYRETTTMTCGKNIFTYEDQRKILTDTKSNDFHATGTGSYGSYKIYYTELFTDNTLYLRVNNQNFTGKHSQTHNPIPKPGMFTDHAATIQTGTTQIHFEDPQGSFLALPEGAVVIAAEGKLTKSNQWFCILEYRITYKTDQATFETYVEIHYSAATQQLPTPKTDEYIPVEQVLAPLTLEKAYGLLAQSTHLSANCGKEFYNAVNTLNYSSHITLCRQGDSGSILTETTLTDHSRGNEQITTTQKEIFQNGSYSITTDGQPANNLAIDQTQFFNYFSQLLCKNILSAKYVTQTNAVQADGCVAFTFEVNGTLAEKLCQDICQTLYHDPHFLDDQAETNFDHSVIYTITIDPVTDLPMACNLEFSCNHTIASIPYALTAQYEQTIVYE